MLSPLWPLIGYPVIYPGSPIGMPFHSFIQPPSIEPEISVNDVQPDCIPGDTEP